MFSREQREAAEFARERWERQKKILTAHPWIVVVMVLGIVGIYFLFQHWGVGSSDTPLSEGGVTIKNDLGETLELEVLRANPQGARRHVSGGLLDSRFRKSPIVYVSDRGARRDQSFAGGRRPLEIALFDEEGSLLEVLYTPGSRGHDGHYEGNHQFHHALIGRDGFLDEHRISRAGGASLVPEEPRAFPRRAPVKDRTKRARPPIPSARPAPPAGPPCESESVRRQQILDLVAGLGEPVDECMAHGSGEEAPGPVAVEWRVRPSGSPTRMSVLTPEYRDTHVGRCLIRMVRELRFEACEGSEDEHTVSVWYSFEASP